MVFERPISALLSRVIDAAHSSRSNGGRSPSKLNERNLGSVAFQEQEPRGLESDLQGLRTNSATGMSETLMASRAARQSHLSQRDAKRTKDGRRLSTTSFNFDSNVNEDASESPNLEMTIEYDKNQSLPPFQRDSTGHSHEQIGPIGYLFRWYTKRATQFSPGFPSPDDIPDAPVLPSDNLNPSASSHHSHSHSHHPPSPSAPAPQQIALETGTIHSPSSTAAPGTRARSRRASYSSWDEGLPPKGGRSLNRAPDPVMNLQELELMLEDLDVVPTMCSRHDVAHAFSSSFASAPTTPLPGQLPLAQIRPDEIRFPQFQECLVRIALVAWGLDESSIASMTSDHRHSPAIHAVRLLMEKIGADHSSIMLLQRRLDSLARTVNERSGKKSTNKLSHVASGNGVEAARHLMARLRDEGAWPSELGSWDVDDPTPPPHVLVTAIMHYDESAKRRYKPDWKLLPSRESGEQVLEVGHIKVGELRSFRILLRNRGTNTMHLRVDTIDASSHSSSSSSGLACSFSELPMPPGVPRVLHVETRWSEKGHYQGVIRIRSYVKKDGYQCSNIVSWNVTVA